jgi:hypothetical protein
VALIAKVVKKSYKGQKSSSKSSIMSFYVDVWYLCAVKQRARPGCGLSRSCSKKHLIFQGLQDFSKSAQWHILRILSHLGNYAILAIVQLPKAKGTAAIILDGVKMVQKLNNGVLKTRPSSENKYFSAEQFYEILNKNNAFRMIFTNFCICFQKCSKIKLHNCLRNCKLPLEFLIFPPMQCNCRIALGIAQNAIGENALLQNSLISFKR